MSGTWENALVKIAYKVSGSGQVGFKFRGKFNLDSPKLIAMNNEFKLYFSTESGTDTEGGRVYINTEISRGAFLSEKKFMALLAFFKDCAEIVSGIKAGRESTIENERYCKHKTHKIYMLCEALDGIKTYFAECDIARAKQEAAEREAKKSKIAKVVNDCNDWDILWDNDKERIEFVFTAHKKVEKVYFHQLPDELQPDNITVNNLIEYYKNRLENLRITAKFQEVKDKYFADNPKANNYYNFPDLSLNIAERVMNFLSFRHAIKRDTKKMIYDAMKSEGYKIKFQEE